ncbi:4a-hydroxytetrahydrobiopterin dehydratase [Adhaeribacter pallidiroseus]|uniref:4a-hydroxytetrahydrobiopterin dehydratase n=1 Tax=Adhaeribacter pallidiroseus TaxID=2072847 RepID=A0A369QLE4_9BACT|nr:4a-hydroxytetrahydrobiopterin dehydratase [Adhaeribacter pallidiroseus]RDC65731.1 4a-hydroxytetrahydrobiopterin dehydratase [Adhaeribacter pallidiroseus]
MWVETDNRLKKTFRFPDFKSAFAFMTEVATVAEEMDHHPEWRNMYNVVSFELYTFDASNTVTKRDHKLAQRIDEIAAAYSLK